MEKRKSLFFGRDIFAKAFREFDEERFFEDLEKRVKPQSYFRKYKSFKGTITALSYLFNIVSALTASYLVFWLTQWLTGIAVLSYILSAVFLFFLEQLKRKSSNEFFQSWYFENKTAVGWLLLSLSVFGVSVASTYYGTDKATWNFAPPPTLITQDSTLNSLNLQLQETESQIAAARSTRWKGTTTSKSQQTISDLTSQKTLILTEIGEREEKKDKNNNVISQKHLSEIKVTASTLAWITVLFELLFELCIAYIWYYYYRSFVERKRIIPKPDEPVSKENEVSPKQEDTQIFNELLSLFNNQKNGKHVETDNGSISDNSSSIGFYTDTQRKDKMINLFKQHLELFKQPNLEDSNKYKDKYTIAHKDLKSGQIKHLNIGNLSNRIDIYVGRVQKAFANDNLSVIPNQLLRLEYWLNRRSELMLKLNEHKGIMN